MILNFGRYTQQQLGGYKATSRKGFRNGEDNLFPDYLDGLFNASVTHQGIINDLASYIVGKGLYSPNPAQQALLDRHFPKKKLTKIILLDLIQNCKSLEVRKDNLFNIQHIDIILPKQIRVAELHGGDPAKFIYRESWREEDAGYRIKDELMAYHKNCELQKSLFYAYDSGTFPVPYGRPYYMSGLNAIELEAGIYLMHNHGVQNGMFPSMIIERETSGSEGEDYTSTSEIVKATAGAGNAGKIVDVKRPQGAQPATITAPSLTGIDKIYNSQYQTSEAGISKAHGLPSPTLIAGLNIKPTGFGDAEEEMQWALNQWKQKKFLPYRADFIDDLKDLFEDLGITEVEFLDEETENKVVMSKDPIQTLIDSGEDEIEGFVEISSVEINAELDLQMDKELEELGVLKFVDTGTARPNAKSEQDGEKGNVQYKVRYRYEGTRPAEREFCRRMLEANKLYRKEDIERMTTSNPQFAPKGASSYDVFEWKGGVYCKHKWERVTFVKKGLEGSIDVRNPNSKNLTEEMADERGMDPNNPAIVGTKPNNTPSRGRLNFLKQIRDGIRR